MNYFFLELDTTEPQINIYAPTSTSGGSNDVGISGSAYANRVQTEELRIEASEPLLEYQNIYCIDSSGKKHDMIFSRISDTEYVGEIMFSGYPYGIATIFAQMQDEVGNPSRLATFNINIIPVFNSYSLNMNLTESVVGLNMSEEASNPVTKEQINNLEISEKVMTNLQLNFKLDDQARVKLMTSDKSLMNLNIYDADA